MESRLDSNEDVVQYLDRHERKEILRFVTVGSVDDGKSTLIGRLLHDTSAVYDDQLSAVKRASSMAGTEIDFSLFTDGLQAEREQGITIDVAYRYFSTAQRKFIIADTPGHVQYTRNMATGASTASLAITLIDARLGVLQQSRRHAYIASLLAIPHLVVCVNKMDLVGYDAKVFEAIKREFSDFVAKLNFQGVTYIPMSALKGDNVVSRSSSLAFYTGPTLLEHLETVPIGADRNLADFRFPVQYVLRPSHEYRGYAAQIASGVVKKGDPMMVLPSRKTSRVLSIDVDGQTRDEAFAPMSIAIRLADEIDVSRGDMLVHPDNVPRAARRFDAMLVWMHERKLDRGKSYLLKHTTQTVRAEIADVAYAVDLETLAEAKVEGLGLNDIGRVTVHAHRPIFFDAYDKNRATGAFILIDSLTNDTVAAGMIVDASTRARSGEGDASREGQSLVSAREKRDRLGHGAAAIVLHGAAHASVKEAALVAERVLFDRGCLGAVIDAHALGAAGARAAATACVEAGLIAIVMGDTADALGERFAEARAKVIAIEASEDAEAVATQIARALEANGVLAG